MTKKQLSAIRAERSPHMSQATFTSPILALHALRHELQGATVEMQDVPMKYNAGADTWQYMGKKPLTLWNNSTTEKITISPFAPIDNCLFLYNFATDTPTLPTP